MQAAFKWTCIKIIASFDIMHSLLLQRRKPFGLVYLSSVVVISLNHGPSNLIAIIFIPASQRHRVSHWRRLTLHGEVTWVDTTVCASSSHGGVSTSGKMLLLGSNLKPLLAVIKLQACEVNIHFLNYFNTTIVLGLLLNRLVCSHLNESVCINLLVTTCPLKGLMIHHSDTRLTVWRWRH